MREELTTLGFTELLTPDDVDAFMSEKGGTALIVVNSVCGCAAGMARPGVRLALQQGPRPDRLATVFAGQDVDATERAREYIDGFRPSSPSIALFQNGKHVFMLERHQIEGRDASDIAGDLKEAYDRFCQVD